MLTISVCKGCILLDELKEKESSHTDTKTEEKDSSYNGRNALALLCNLTSGLNLVASVFLVQFFLFLIFFLKLLFHLGRE